MTYVVRVFTWKLNLWIIFKFYSLSLIQYEKSSITSVVELRAVVEWIAMNTTNWINKNFITSDPSHITKFMTQLRRVPEPMSKISACIFHLRAALFTISASHLPYKDTGGYYYNECYLRAPAGLDGFLRIYSVLSANSISLCIWHSHLLAATELNYSTIFFCCVN